MKSLHALLKFKTVLLKKTNCGYLMMEAGISKIALTIFILTCSYSAAMAKSNLNFASIAFASEVPFNIKHTALDDEIGKDIIQLFNDLNKNELNTRILTKTIVNLKKKGHSFSSLTPILERMADINLIKNKDNFYNYCTVQPRQVNEFTENLAHRLDITSDRYCRFLFLQNLKKLNANMNLSTRDLNYMKEASAFYINGENQTEVASVLKHFKPNKIEHQKISNILIDQYIENKTKPTTAILANLHANKSLNDFLKNNLHLDNKSNSYFQDEFQKIYRQSQEQLDAGDHATAKKTITSALEFYKKNSKHIEQRRAWLSLTLSAKAFFNKGRDSDSSDIFLYAREIAPKDLTSEATFHLLWPHILNKDYKAMKKVVEKYKLEETMDQHDSKLRFWIAYSLYKTGDKATGNKYFHQIINSTPYSFYSIIALKELAFQNKESTEEEILSKLISNQPPKDYEIKLTSAALQDTLKRLNLWNRLGNERFATLEQRHLQGMKKETAFLDESFVKTVSDNDYKEFMTLNLVRLLNHQEKFIASFKIFQDSLGENSLSINYKLMKYIFPSNYLSIIEKNSKDLDPILVISLIRQESAFNPNATSRVGARGLMQLMPATAKRMNRKVQTKQLSNPEVNVKLGTQYLRQLFERFDGNLIFTLASYNAGENRIDRWKKEIFRNDDPLATIEAIPFEETRNYVKLIYRNKFFYSLLSNRSVLTIPLEETFKVSFSEEKEQKQGKDKKAN